MHKHANDITATGDVVGGMMGSIEYLISISFRLSVLSIIILRDEVLFKIYVCNTSDGRC